MVDIRKLDELMAQYFPEQEYLIDRFIPESSITILSGASGSFKTYTLLEMAISVASGRPLFEQFKSQQTGVLIIDEENGERLMQKRLKQLKAENDLPIYFTSNLGFTLTAENIRNTIDFCTVHDIKLVIIDSLIRVHGSDENSAKDMAQVFKGLRRFTEEGLSVLLTQHNRKQGAYNGGAGNEMRGSTDIRAAIDCHIGVSRRQKWYLTFDQTKQRYDVELEPFKVKVSADTDSFTFEYLGSEKADVDKAQVIYQKVCELLTEHGKLSKKQLLLALRETEASTNEHTLKELLSQWVTEGLLPQPKRGMGKTQLYSTSEETSDE